MHQRLFQALLGGLIALTGFVGVASASATIDLIWAETGTNEIGHVAPSSTITLQVILTAGPNGSLGAGMSVDYSDAVGTLTVLDYMSTPDPAVTDPLPLALGSTIDTGSRIENIISVAFPSGSLGTGLQAGESKQLGVVIFHKSDFSNGSVEIRSDVEGPTDDVLDLAGNNISSSTTFHSAFLCGDEDSCPAPMPTAPTTSTPTPTPSPTPSPAPTVAADPTIDLIWDLNGSATIADVPDGSDIRLNVILTAGSTGLLGASVSVDYSQASGLSVVSFANTPSVGADSPLPGSFVNTADTGTRVEDINAIAFPLGGYGTGLAAGESYQLGTVTFNKSADVGGGTFEIRSDADGPTDAVLNLAGENIKSSTTFNSAYLSNVAPSPTPAPIEPLTVAPSACELAWPSTTIVTRAKGQGSTRNAKLTHTVQGNIIDPDSVRETSHRIAVCSGTLVTSVVTDTSGTPSNTPSGSLVCLSTGCSGVVNATESYRSISADGRDRDTVTFIPQ